MSQTRRRKKGSVRVRVTAATTFFFAAGLIAMGWMMVSWIRVTLLEDITARNSELLNLAVERLSSTIDPRVIRSDESALALPESVREDLEAVAGTARLELHFPPGSRPMPGTNTQPLRLAVIGELHPADASPRDWLVTEYEFTNSAGSGSLVAASPLADVQQSVLLMKQTMWVFIPALIMAVGSFSWVSTGQALRPVEAITNRVSDISSATLSARVPVPSSGDEISTLAATMNAMLDRLESAATRERQFLSNASHELRSPVAAIKAQLETAIAYPESAEWPAIAGVVAAQVDRLEDLVDNLFMLSRLDESDDRLLNFAEVDLDEIVMANSSHIAGLTVDTRNVGAARVAGDVMLLTSVVRNLVENAAHYAKSTIRIELGHSHDDELGAVARLTVEDDGKGISMADRGRVFERFARLDEGRARGHGGAGIGLALVKSAIERHGGSTRIVDGRLGGACFEVLIPLLGDSDDGDDFEDSDDFEQPVYGRDGLDGDRGTAPASASASGQFAPFTPVDAGTAVGAVGGQRYLATDDSESVRV